LAKKPIELPGSFYEDWLITEVVRVVKSGKEATVYCCRAHPSQGTDLLAAAADAPPFAALVDPDTFARMTAVESEGPDRILVHPTRFAQGFMKQITLARKLRL